MLLYLVCKLMDIYGYTKIRRVCIWSAIHAYGYFRGQDTVRMMDLDLDLVAISVQTRSIAILKYGYTSTPSFIAFYWAPICTEHWKWAGLSSLFCVDIASLKNNYDSL
jgi:hypothetical protein